MPLHGTCLSSARPAALMDGRLLAIALNGGLYTDCDPCCIWLGRCRRGCWRQLHYSDALRVDADNRTANIISTERSKFLSVCDAVLRACLCLLLVHSCVRSAYSLQMRRRCRVDRHSLCGCYGPRPVTGRHSIHNHNFVWQLAGE